MELTRVIHPIGQGGFYTETFMDDNNVELFNMVYDCGSETNKSRFIEPYLKQYISGSNKSIDVVFISHLHDDHINGLDYLLRTTTVKNLFLPQLTPDMIMEAYIYNYIKAGTFNNPSNDCITNIIRGTYNKTRIVEIIESNGDESFDRGESMAIGDNLKPSYPSGTVFTVNGNVVCPNGNHVKWLYIPFNSPIVSKKGLISKDARFASAIDSNGKVDPNKLKDLIEKEGTHDCKELYVDYYGRDHNAYSMTLFSGLEKPHFISRYKGGGYHGCWCMHRRHNSPNFIYTGDFKPNMKLGSSSYVEMMKRRLENMDLWDTISGIQVPHHGSRYNFNIELYQFPCKGYVSVGSTNAHHHPHVDTMINIQKAGCVPVVVSEDLNSMQIEVYEILCR